jgi:hypothetical protein
MFGTSFPEPDRQPVPAAAASPLTVEQARMIVAPLYDALNQPGKKDVAGLLAKATNPDYKSYSTNEDWLTRDQLADVFKTLGSAVPNFRPSRGQSEALQLSDELIGRYVQVSDRSTEHAGKHGRLRVAIKQFRAIEVVGFSGMPLSVSAAIRARLLRISGQWRIVCNPK